MILPPDFHFSQNNLQDYVDCPRRFYLTHVMKQSWPAIEVEPYREFERHIESGNRFHKLVQQQKTGIPADILTSQITDPQLMTWWQNYLDFSIQVSTARELVEFTLSMPFTGHRLLAKYDLISIEKDGSITIFDWKTSKHQPKIDRLLGTCQSKVYPFVLSLAGTGIDNQREIAPSNIKMIYWYTEFPQKPIEFRYSDVQRMKDEEFLTGLVTQIEKTQPDGFDRTENLKECNYCVYRSYCERGTTAGDMEEMELPLDESDDLPSVDFDQVPEIEF